MIKLLAIITHEDNEKIVEKIITKFSLLFSMTTTAQGTASNSLLDYFDLDKSDKRLFLTLVSNSYEHEVLDDVNKSLELNKIGNGIAFTINLSSSNKFVYDLLIDKRKEKNIMASEKYHLVVTTVLEGYAEMVVSTAKKNGASGGTIINGRTMGIKDDNFLKLKIEPEKEIILMVIKEEDKEKIMHAITMKAGIKTEAKGVCLSMPISNIIGLNI